MIRIISCFLFLLLFASLMSCKFSDSTEYKIGEQFVKSTSGVVMIDTMKNELSTVLVDSFQTSSTTRLLIGSIKDSYSGTLKSTPYFELTVGTYNVTDEKIEYDSIVFKMKYDGYYIGDTTKLSELNLYWLNKNMKLNAESYLSNLAKFEMKEEPFGKIKFYPTPHNQKVFYTRLDDVMGRDLFKRMLSKTDTLSNTTLFQEVFKGIAIVPTGNSPSSLTGISMDSVSTAPSIRVYFHKVLNSTEETTKTYYELPFNTSGIHFMNYERNFSNSLLKDFQNGTVELPRSKMGELTIAQSLTSVFAKVYIPGIRGIPGFAPKVSFISATLYLFPVADDLTGYRNLPDTLNIYTADHMNRIAGQLSTTSGSYVYATKYSSTDLDKTPYYAVDLTSFFDTKIGETSVTNQTLFFEPKASKMYSTMQTVVLGSSLSYNKPCRLQIYCYINHN